MTNEENIKKLEKIYEDIIQVANLFNNVSYEARPKEIFLIDQIAQLATTCQKLVRL